MSQNRYVLAGGFLAFLLLANIVYYFCSGWGLITVKVHDVPLRQVIKSIEWQGWVKIYTNIDSDTKVSMYVDHVPLPEALDTLAANITIPEPPRTDGGTPPATANANPATPGTPPAGGPGGRGPGGGRGGGFGRGAQWGLAFFVAGTSGDVKSLINSFETSSTDDSLKTYNYPSMLGMVLTPDEDGYTPVADPRQQTWPGMKTPVVPVSTNPTTDTTAQSTPNPASSDGQPAATQPDAPSSAQDYLRAFAQSADVFIMSNSAWDPPVPTPPAASSSLIGAIKSFVSDHHGAVTQAFILRTRGGRPQGGGQRRGGFAGDDTGWDDCLRNAINGLPDEARASALSQLDQEVNFRKQVQAAPPEQRGDMWRQHMQDKISNAPFMRLSPEKRAERYQRMVASRMAAQGK